MGDQNSSGSKEGNESSDRPRPRFSPFSPFPYGSPMSKMTSLQSSFSGSPGQKLLLSGANLSQSRSNGEVLTPRLKGQDLYGGPIIFGSAARRSRLLSASPYSAAVRSRTVEKQSRLERVSSLQPSLGRVAPPPSSLPSTAPSSPHSSPGPSVSPPAPLSSTARLILSTLEKLSSGGTPVTDAKKIPLSSPSSSSRAEKRKLLETELNCSFSPSRRRPRLGGGGLALSLSGPPLRKNFSPVASSVSGASQSPARLNTASPGPAASSVRNKTSVTPATISSERKEQSPPITTTSSVTPSTGTDTPAPPPMLPANQTKSSLKMKSKVADSGRSKVDLTASSSLAPALTPGVSAPAPDSSLSLMSLPAPQLQVEKLPVFNFTAAPALAPILPLKQNPAKPSAEVKPSSPPAHSVASVSPIPPEVLERNNNDKSPNKRLINETDDQLSSSETKKVKNAEVSSLASKAGAVEVLPREDLARAFSFSVPQSVIQSSEIEAVTVTEAPRSYIFTPPSLVEAGGNSEIKKIINGPTKLSDSGVSATTVPCFNLPPSTSSSNTEIRNQIETNFLNKAMPDITNNTLRKTSSTNKLKGSNSNSGLPDVTASTGFGGFLPAKELKTGSVMDILGKKL